MPKNHAQKTENKTLQAKSVSIDINKYGKKRNLHVQSAEYLLADYLLDLRVKEALFLFDRLSDIS